MLDFLIDTVHAAGNLGNAGDLFRETGSAAGVGNTGDASLILGNVIQTALSMVGAIFLVLSLYAGYMWMAARGEEDKIKKAQEILKGSIVGLIIVISAYVITVTIANRLGADTSGPGLGEDDAPTGPCCIWNGAESVLSENEMTERECRVFAESGGVYYAWNATECNPGN